MLFTFINSGWEGSAHDNAILVDSITRADLQFPHPPNGECHEITYGTFFEIMFLMLCQIHVHKYQHLRKYSVLFGDKHHEVCMENVDLLL